MYQLIPYGLLIVPEAKAFSFLALTVRALYEIST